MVGVVGSSPIAPTKIQIKRISFHRLIRFFLARGRLVGDVRAAFMDEATLDGDEALAVQRTWVLWVVAVTAAIGQRDRSRA